MSKRDRAENETPVPYPRPPDVIFCADIHLTDKRPPCRTDDWWAAQQKKLIWLRDLCNKRESPLVIAGDLFDEPVPSYRVLNLAMGWLAGFKQDVVLVAGQHDMPFHREDFDSSALGCLRWLLSTETGSLGAGQVEHYRTAEYDMALCPFGTEPPPVSSATWKVLVWHKMVCGKEDATLKTHAGGADAHAVLRRFLPYHLIVTGDNHRPFLEQDPNDKRRKLVNCGSLMRRRADQAKHQPLVWAWWASTNEILPIQVPIDKGVVSREHIDEPKEKDTRLAAFIERLDGASTVDVSDGFVEAVISLIEKTPPELRPALRSYLRAIVNRKEPDYDKG